MVKESKFYDCLRNYLTYNGEYQASNVILSEDGTQILGFRQAINTVYVKSAAIEGVKILKDIRTICDNAPYGKFFSFTQRYYDFESYVVFNKELTSNVVLALLAVFVVILTVTANLTVTAMVLFCVALVDLFLFSLLAMWDVKLNSVTVVNIVIAIGLAVDYSAHIGHSYLMVEPPDFDRVTKRPLSNFEKRVFKARGALGKMGSSVFHGALSTFLAIIVLSPSDSYIFKSFFKMWFGIIIYGVANGFILLPVMLSLCGPISGLTYKRKVQHRAPSDKDAAGKQPQKATTIELNVLDKDLEGAQDASSEVSSDTVEDLDDGGQGGETEAQRRRREKAAQRAALKQSLNERTMQNQQDLDAQAARLKLAEHGGQGLLPGSSANMADVDARHAELLAQQLGVPDDQAQRRALREQRRELKR